MRSRKQSIVIKRELERVAPGIIRRALPFAGVILVVTLLCLTINYRALLEHRREEAVNHDLSTQIETATAENLAIQEEIHYLKNDVNTIEREARKIGLKRPKEEISKPTK